MSLIKVFKDFAVKGNVVDLAVGIIIGGAFGKIVTSLVSDIIMPPLGLAVSQVDFKDLKLVLVAAEGTKNAVTLNYGLFLQNIFDFTIVAIAVFFLVKTINALKRMDQKKEEEKQSLIGRVFNPRKKEDQTEKVTEKTETE